eukprot:TRINITY_DN324_c0_g1_i3.p1 TRINITY_DN324_c0_g1~~TRINITY_DN324_c0_g1_i3.p1  ORF type:complete len:832 (+),score=362.11 TRINITY_DN324_c0_g1_i3:64-2559(+)
MSDPRPEDEHVDASSEESGEETETPTAPERRHIDRSITLNSLVKQADNIGPQLIKNIKRDDPTWTEERECLLSLLHARMLLRSIIEIRLAEERYAAGNLSVHEIQNILKNQREDVETDWIAEIQELKRNMIAEIRKNHALEKQLASLDKRISLLIKHRSNIKEIIAAATAKKPKANKERDTARVELTSKQMEAYQHLFYLLQTAPEYLARLCTLVQPERMDNFLDTVILTLFGDAFSPREEFLILSLYKLAISQEMSQMKSVGDLLSVDSVVPKMIITYNRRKQGHQFLKQVIAPILDTVINQADLNLELNPVTIYHTMISDIEIQTGTKSNLNRNMKEDEILEQPDVKRILGQRIEKCTAICEAFFRDVLANVGRLPYGVRWIAKQIQQIAQKNFGSSDDEIDKVFGYFVYYRFINLAIVTPDAFDLVDKELSILARKNLVVISKVLQTLFTLNVFQGQGGEKWLLPFNSWIKKQNADLKNFFRELPKVTDPSEYLRVDKYNELTLKINPVIVISLQEISQTHQVLLEHQKTLKLKPANDPLENILGSLPPPPEISDANDREIQLTLVNKFKENLDEDVTSGATLYAETKELVIGVFKGIPLQKKREDEGLDDLIGLLHSAQQFGKENGQPQITENATKILANLAKLEADKIIIGSKDNYESFLRGIALEVTNRAEIREQQRKENTRLTFALRELRKHGAYLNDQIQQYTNYLRDVMNHYGPKDASKKSAKHIKFTYKELSKKGIIVSSDVPKLGQKTMVFYIWSETPGEFEVDAKLAGKSVVPEPMKLYLDELLEKANNNVSELQLDSVTLDVNLTLHLLNRNFLKKIK